MGRKDPDAARHGDTQSETARGRSVGWRTELAHGIALRASLRNLLGKVAAGRASFGWRFLEPIVIYVCAEDNLVITTGAHSCSL